MAIGVVVGMRVRLRKIHPCGADTWRVTRTGADVGMLCEGWGRRIMLEREEFERRVRHVISNDISEYNTDVNTDVNTEQKPSGESSL